MAAPRPLPRLKTEEANALKAKEAMPMPEKTNEGSPGKDREGELQGTGEAEAEMSVSELGQQLYSQDINVPGLSIAVS